MNILKSRVVIGLALIVIMVLIIMLIFNVTVSDASEGETKFKEFEVKRGTFQIVVSASGVVKPIDRIEIKSKASGQQWLKQKPI